MPSFMVTSTTCNIIPFYGKVFPGKETMERPKEFLGSVDNALRMILLLQERGKLTVSQAASELDVAVSTAHRTLQMLVYHEFAVPTESKTYVVGPSLSLGHKRKRQGDKLRGIAQPYLEKLARETGETTHLIMLEGAEATFVHSVEGTQLVHVGKRIGLSFPAYKNAAGLHMLTHFSAGELRELLSDLDDEEFLEVRKKVQRARSMGFGINNRVSEQDVTALGCALTNELGDVLGGIAISIPHSRFKQGYSMYASTLVRYSRELNRILSNTSKRDL
ncbi:IclR family transcriptional regulator [Rothia nasimurium]|uniref:IclR family transcriptional regulator n=1 Tax=Rothia nasimurium TaxID=85336 RepID=UPI001F4129E1|nr:IclR family transcriptional regulator [Rothia nasimurium]